MVNLVGTTRYCGWCRGEIRRGARRDTIFCKKPCRQAAHRAKIGRAQLSSGTCATLRLAYADPPYPGQAKRYYADHPDYAGEVNLDELLSRLQPYDGWALSTSAASLPDVLARCVARGLPVRVAIWERGARPHAQARILNGWEPVVFIPGRRRRADPQDVVVDVLRDVVPRRRKTLPSYVVGAKPPAFCAWMFQLLGATVGDTLDDLFPGSGMVARSWSWYQGRDPSREYSRDASPAAAVQLDTTFALTG